MVAIADRQTERATFDALDGRCAAAVEGETWFCSRSCETLGRHFLIFPSTYETYDETVARARRESPATRIIEEGEACPAPSWST